MSAKPSPLPVSFAAAEKETLRRMAAERGTSLSIVACALVKLGLEHAGPELEDLIQEEIHDLRRRRVMGGRRAMKIRWGQLASEEVGGAMSANRSRPDLEVEAATEVKQELGGSDNHTPWGILLANANNLANTSAGVS